MKSCMHFVILTLMIFGVSSLYAEKNAPKEGRWFIGSQLHFANVFQNGLQTPSPGYWWLADTTYRAKAGYAFRSSLRLSLGMGYGGGVVNRITHPDQWGNQTPTTLYNRYEAHWLHVPLVFDWAPGGSTWKFRPLLSVELRGQKTWGSWQWHSERDGTTINQGQLSHDVNWIRYSLGAGALFRPGKRWEILGGWHVEDALLAQSETIGTVYSKRFLPFSLPPRQWRNFIGFSLGANYRLGKISN